MRNLGFMQFALRISGKAVSIAKRVVQCASSLIPKMKKIDLFPTVMIEAGTIQFNIARTPLQQ